jgi:hypothetical protein
MASHCITIGVKEVEQRTNEHFDFPIIDLSKFDSEAKYAQPEFDGYEQITRYLCTMATTKILIDSVDKHLFQDGKFVTCLSFNFNDHLTMDVLSVRFRVALFIQELFKKWKPEEEIVFQLRENETTVFLYVFDAKKVAHKKA